MGLRTVHVYFDTAEARIAQGKLEAYGISAFLNGISTVEVNPAYMFAFGGIRLDVPESSLDDARALLNVDDEPGLDQCPKCGSNRILYQRDKGFALLAFLLGGGAPSNLSTSGRYCRSCKHQWQASGEDAGGG